MGVVPGHVLAAEGLDLNFELLGAGREAKLGVGFEATGFPRLGADPVLDRSVEGREGKRRTDVGGEQQPNVPTMGLDIDLTLIGHADVQGDGSRNGLDRDFAELDRLAVPGITDTFDLDDQFPRTF